MKKTVLLILLTVASAFALDVPPRSAEETVAIQNIIAPRNEQIKLDNLQPNAVQKPLLTPDSYEVEILQGARKSWVQSDIQSRADQLESELIALPPEGRREAIEVLLPIIAKHKPEPTPEPEASPEPTPAPTPAPEASPEPPVTE